MTKLSLFTLTLICIAQFFSTAQAGISNDPRLNWQTLTSSHFAVHYHDGEEQLAKTTIAIAERVHEKLAPLFQWMPTELTDIVLTDQIDFFNGSATAIPTNLMTLHVSPPDMLTGIEDHAGAMETLITHEYVHILQLNKATRTPLAARSIFGRFFLLFPGMFQPGWLVEGLATYYETDPARSIGRGQSSAFDALMRTEYSCGIKPLRQVNQPIASWPSGAVPYLYGVNFYQFIADRYGAEKIQQLVTQYSGNMLPFSLNSTSRQVFGKDMDGLWDEFETYLQQKYQPQLTALQEQGEVSGQRIDQRGYVTTSVRALADGTVIYFSFNGITAPALMRLRPGIQQPEHLAEVHQGARFDLHPEAGIVLAQPEFSYNANLFYDLYRIDLNSGKQRRLTQGARYRAVTWSPDGKQMVALHSTLGRHELHRLDADGKLIEVLWRGESGVTLSDPNWSPNGMALVMSVWRPEGGWNLEQFNLADRTFTQLTQQTVIEAQPRYSADGTAVLFSADNGGVYNLRQLNLASGEITTLTHVTSGAFEPNQATVGGPIYYTGYDCDGLDIYRLDQPQSLPTPAASDGPSGIPLPPAPLPQGLTINDYSPYSRLRPRWWFPHLAIESGRTELGFITSANDPLYRHNYQLNAAYDFSNQAVVGSLDYIYDRYFPIFKLHAQQLNQLERGGNDTLLRVRQEQSYQAEVVLPYVQYNRTVSLHAAAISDETSDHWLAQNVTPRASRTDNLLGLAVVYDSARRYPLAISRSNGMQVQLAAENSDALSGSDYSGTTYLLDSRAFINVGGSNVLALRLAAGLGTEQPRPFQLGGSRSAGQTNMLLGAANISSPFNQRSYALRGYSSGQANLVGSRMALASLEWRFPIKLIERGIMAPPVALHQLHGLIFVESGDAWYKGQQRSYASSAGVELRADLIAFYGLGLETRLGYAHGFDNGGDNEIYLQLGSSF